MGIEYEGAAEWVESRLKEARIPLAMNGVVYFMAPLIAEVWETYANRVPWVSSDMVASVANNLSSRNIHLRSWVALWYFNETVRAEEYFWAYAQLTQSNYPIYGVPDNDILWSANWVGIDEWGI